MAISATFSKTNKKINSTAQPVAAASDITLQVELKDVTNLFTPSLVISTDVFMSGGQIKNPMQYNYCYLPDFERYYFVRSWSWILGRWECSLEVDVLATFKTEIGNTNAFVLRAASQYDPDIIDTKYPCTMDIAGALQDKQVLNGGNPWNVNIKNANITQGFYVISVVNSDVSAVGGVSHYALSASVMQELMNKLFSAPTWMNITDANISADLQKMLFNPMQYITSCMWIPAGLNTTGMTSTNTLPLGWWSLTLTGGFYRIEASNSAIEISRTVAIPYHPQYDASKRRWLQLSPYTTIALYFPPFGFIPLDSTKLYLCDLINIKVRIDIITGRGTLYVTSTYTLGGVQYAGGLVYSSVSQVGIPVQVAQMAVSWDMLSSASTWVTAAGISLATGGLQESIKDLKNGLIDGARSIFNNPQAKNYLSAAGGGIGALFNSGINTAMSRGLSQGAAVANEIATGLQKGLGNAPQETSLLDSLKQIAGDIGSTALAAAGTCTSSGSSGGFAALQEDCFLQAYFMPIVGRDDTHNGLPLCRSTLIRNLSGFILCGNTDDFSANCTPAERQAVRAIMEAGFYYE